MSTTPPPLRKLVTLEKPPSFNGDATQFSWRKSKIYS